MNSAVLGVSVSTSPYSELSEMATAGPVEEVIERVARWARASRGEVLWSGEAGIVVMFKHAGSDYSNRRTTAHV